MARKNALKSLILLERETGFEPATLALARRCSTAELFPLGRFRVSPDKASFRRWCRCLERILNSLPVIKPHMPFFVEDSDRTDQKPIMGI